MAHQGSKRAGVASPSFGGKSGEILERFSVAGFGAREAFWIQFHPGRGIVRKSIFPTAEPQKYEMYVVLSRDFHPVIQNTEIKAALFWLDLLPCDRHQDGIDVHGRELRNNGIRLRGGSCGG